MKNKKFIYIFITLISLLVFLFAVYKIFMLHFNYKKEIFLYIIIGFFAGIISGFFGAGGGLLLVPFMTKILKKGEVTARATTIMCIFFMVLASSFFYYKQNSIDWNIALKSSIGGILGGYLGSKLLVKLGVST